MCMSWASAVHSQLEHTEKLKTKANKTQKSKTKKTKDQEDYMAGFGTSFTSAPSRSSVTRTENDVMPSSDPPERDA